MISKIIISKYNRNHPTKVTLYINVVGIKLLFCTRLHVHKVCLPYRQHPTNCALIAQLVERGAENSKVVSSSLT